MPGWAVTPRESAKPALVARILSKANSNHLSRSVEWARGDLRKPQRAPPIGTTDADVCQTSA
jgi:hypothetical protein